MGRHPSKISRIEHGTALPSDEDIRAWCRHCHADEQIPDLVASVRVGGMWVEWRRVETMGLRHAQQSLQGLYQTTRLFRAYSPALVPGIVQTPAYTKAILAATARSRHLPDDIAPSIAPRTDPQKLLHHGDHRLAILIEQAALHTGIGGEAVMAAQLNHLINVSRLPRVSLGVLPAGTTRDTAWPVEGFCMFDDAEVQVELVSGQLTVKQPSEVALYARAFTELGAIARHGASALEILTATHGALQHPYVRLPTLAPRTSGKSSRSQA
jgi:hypothetical protein